MTLARKGGLPPLLAPGQQHFSKETMKMNVGQSKKHARSRARWVRVFIGCSVLTSLCWSLRQGAAQSGVLILSSSSKPDAATLSLQVMNVDVLIDNEHARVGVLQF